MPKPILASLVLALAVIGSYAVNGSIVEVWVMIGFGALGCAMKHFNLPREPLVLGLVLGTMAESELARALALVQGDVGQLLLGIFSSPICMILIGLILYSIIRSQYKKRKASASRLTKKRNYRKKPGLQRLPDLFPLPLHEEEEVSSAETDFSVSFHQSSVSSSAPSSPMLTCHRLVTKSRASFIRPFEGLTLSALYPLKNKREAGICVSSP